MGFRFQRRIRILPGVSLNIGKSGVSSVSTGVRGFRVNWGKKGTRTTTSLPGTGLSYQSSVTPYQPSSSRPPKAATKQTSGVWIAVILFGLLWAVGKCTL